MPSMPPSLLAFTYTQTPLAIWMWQRKEICLQTLQSSLASSWQSRSTHEKCSYKEKTDEDKASTSSASTGKVASDDRRNFCIWNIFHSRRHRSVGLFVWNQARKIWVTMNGAHGRQFNDFHDNFKCGIHNIVVSQTNLFRLTKKTMLNEKRDFRIMWMSKKRAEIKINILHNITCMLAVSCDCKKCWNQ